MASFTEGVELPARLFHMAAKAKSKPAQKSAVLLFQSWATSKGFRTTDP